MKTVVAKFSGGGTYTCKYKIIDHPAEWHAEDLPGLEDSGIPDAFELSLESYLHEYAASLGQTVEITAEGESAFAIR